MRFTLDSALALGVLLSTPVNAFIRMQCGKSNLVTQRIDPIVSPGLVAGHVHQIAGGNGFGFTATYAGTRKSTCSTCEIMEDLSNYWTPILYYTDRQGKLSKVDQGGMTIYYFEDRAKDPQGNANKNKAYPEGFRMLAGNPFRRNATTDSAGMAVNFVCLGVEGPLTNVLPTQICPNGLRAQVYFPSCWDGKNLDSADHRSHVAYPLGNLEQGPCPTTHPVPLASIFYEVIFNTAAHEFWQGNYGTGQPFVFSNGDATGAGFHGDFLNGWDVPVLQNFLDTCHDGSGNTVKCAAVTKRTDAEKDSCMLPPSVDEDIRGPMSLLPGCNAITGAGPAATPNKNCDVTPIAGPILPFTDSTSKGWAYQGCAFDDLMTRTLSGYSTGSYQAAAAPMTVDKCLQVCADKKFLYAGLQFGQECYCGNSVASDRAPIANEINGCSKPCTGNPSQICGGEKRLSLYKSCTGTACKNVEYKPIGDLYGISGKAAVGSDVAVADVTTGMSAPAAMPTTTAIATTSPAAAWTAITTSSTTANAMNSPAAMATSITTSSHTTANVMTYPGADTAMPTSSVTAIAVISSDAQMTTVAKSSATVNVMTSSAATLKSTMTTSSNSANAIISSPAGESSITKSSTTAFVTSSSVAAKTTTTTSCTTRRRRKFVSRHSAHKHKH